MAVHDAVLLACAGWQLFVAGVVIGRHGWAWGVLVNFAMGVALAGMAMEWWNANVLVVFAVVAVPALAWMFWDTHRTAKAIERDLEFAAIVAQDEDED